MSMYPQSIIVGSWQVVRSEFESSLDRYLHFSPDGEHLWEHPFPSEGVPKLCRFSYRMSVHGVFITPANDWQEGWECPFVVGDDCLIFSHPSGKRWWLKRIAPQERPDFLTCYYAPPGITPVAEQ